MYIALFFLVGGLVLAFFLPRKYTAQCTLGLEMEDRTTRISVEGMSPFQSMPMGDMRNTRIVSPAMYPDIFFSVPFQKELIYSPLYIDERGDTVTFYNYLVSGPERLALVADPSQVEQLTEEAWYSPFPQFQTTERPDRAAQELLNGKAVLLCDNSPVALVVPGAFNSFMESSEDWYNRFEMASFLRVLRYLAMAVATLLPGLYLAVIRFHTQILPANLILSFAQAREGVPFSSVVELVFLELSFELIREAGVRIPGALGNAIGIVGGLIIGQAAVEANLVSPVVVIIVALTALGSLAIPNEEFASAFRLLKYAFLFLGGFLGIFGIVLGLYLTMAHLAGLLSFGVPYLVPFVEKNSEAETGGRILRQPFRKRKFRPLYARNAQKRRLRTRPWSRKG